MVKLCVYFLSIDISFNVQLNERVQFSEGDKIIFDKVISNIGNGYDNNTRIFTVSRNGTYAFTLVTMSTSGVYYASIIVNGTPLSETYGSSGYRTGIFSWIQQDTKFFNYFYLTLFMNTEY